MFWVNYGPHRGLSIKAKVFLPGHITVVVTTVTGSAPLGPMKPRINQVVLA